MMKANRVKYDAQYKEVLTADQYAKYTQMQGQHGMGKGMHDGDAGKMKAKKGKMKMKQTDS